MFIFVFAVSLFICMLKLWTSINCYNWLTLLDLTGYREDLDCCEFSPRENAFSNIWLISHTAGLNNSVIVRSSNHFLYVLGQWIPILLFLQLLPLIRWFTALENMALHRRT